MNGTLFCHVMLLIVGVLAFALKDSQKSNASTDSYNPDNPNDSPFCLPLIPMLQISQTMEIISQTVTYHSHNVFPPLNIKKIL